MTISILAIDIGGSSVKASVASVSSGSALWSPIESHPVVESSLRQLREIVAHIVSATKRCDAIGISTAGTVGLDGQVIRSGAFSDYEMFYWRDELASRGFDGPVTVINDGQAAALAEFDAGKNPDRRNSIHFVIGTGVGGGAVVEARPLTGENGYAGALGHIKVISGPEAVRCGCRGYGCVQTVASARAVVAGYWARLDETGDEEKISNPLAEIAAMNGQQQIALRAALSEGGYWLGRAIGSAINVFNPSLVTIGGGLIEADKKMADIADGAGPYAEAAFAEARLASLIASGAAAELRVGRLANDAGVRGAGIMALRAMKG
jgi:glucokinase